MRPETESAAATAVGPGMVTTCTSRARAAETSAAPGSLTAGVPASVTSATSLPVPRRLRMRRRAASLECAWKLISSAREPRSSRLPSGVATTYRVPAISPRHLPRQAAVEAGRLEHVAVLLRRLLEDLGRRARHHDLDALEQLQRPVHERARQLLRLHHGVGRLGATRHAQHG